MEQQHKSSHQSRCGMHNGHCVVVRGKLENKMSQIVPISASAILYSDGLGKHRPKSWILQRWICKPALSSESNSITCSSELFIWVFHPILLIWGYISWFGISTVNRVCLSLMQGHFQGFLRLHRLHVQLCWGCGRLGVERLQWVRRKWGLACWLRPKSLRTSPKGCY